jgi:hypothetical protein
MNKKRPLVPGLSAWLVHGAKPYTTSAPVTSLKYALPKVAKAWKEHVSGVFSISRVVFAQVGVSSEKDRLGSILLDNSDLPEDRWHVSDERAYRTGAGRSPTEQIRRARKIGSVTVVRRLKNDSSSRLLSLALIPLASEADALAYLPESIARAVRKPFSKVTESGEGFVDGPSVSTLPNAMFYELRYSDPERNGGERIVVGVIDRYLVNFNFRDTSELWPWVEIAAISNLQVAKLQESLSDYQPEAD